MFAGVCICAVSLSLFCAALGRAFCFTDLYVKVAQEYPASPLLCQALPLRAFGPLSAKAPLMRIVGRLRELCFSFAQTWHAVQPLGSATPSVSEGASCDDRGSHARIAAGV